MTLPRKTILWIVVLLGGVFTFGGLSIWNLVTLQRAARGAAAEYAAMDQADATAAQTVWLRDVLRGPDAGAYRDVRFFDPLRAGVAAAVRQLRWSATLDDAATARASSTSAAPRRRTSSRRSRSDESCRVGAGARADRQPRR